ncbi:hypothetical protein KIH74_19220 [Kineosporia sp. J2-2]|uniref:Cell division protein FtsL n=1 Tax=Kineosporia corallincola TaxID=2835133 RepID=A0ABS5TJ03_9ACTN|nr:hypothetical protein [Kineosporia corallincola]MBT0771079.1 hypothetical protein [Kineosporia corallincola]
MTTSTATARVAPDELTGAGRALRQPTRPVRTARPRLRVVPAPRRSAAGLAMLCVGLLGLGLLVLLLLNISIGKGAYELTGLQQQQRELAEQRQALTEQVEAQSAPQKLSAAAKKLGMVPAANPAFIDLDDSSVKGEPEAAAAAPGSDTTKTGGTTTGEPSP